MVIQLRCQVNFDEKEKKRSQDFLLNLQESLSAETGRGNRQLPTPRAKRLSHIANEL